MKNTDDKNNDLTRAKGEDVALPSENENEFNQNEIKEKGYNYTSSSAASETRRAVAVTRPTEIDEGCLIKARREAESRKAAAKSNSNMTVKGDLGNRRWNPNPSKGQPIYPVFQPVPVDCDMLTVLSRIDHALQKRSVEATFDKENNIITCKTCSFLIYSIELFDGPQRDTTILEIIRRQGETLCFRRERKAIIDAANALGAKEDEDDMMRKRQIPQDMLDLYEPPTFEDLNFILERAMDDLHTNYREVQLFALHNLSTMTTPDEYFPDQTNAMSKVILASQMGVKELVASMLPTGTEKDDAANEQVHHACLTILSNLITAMKCDKKYLEENAEWFSESVVPSFVKTLQSPKCLHNAYLALKCLCTLMDISQLVRDQVKGKHDVIDAIEEAMVKGKTEHYNLQVQATSALQVLQQCQ